jgi:hypothetical protein
MPAIILSDNGVSSGSAGLKTSGSNDGILALQTTTAGGTATTAVTISSTQAVTFAGATSYTGLATFSKGSSNGITIGDVTTNSNSVLRLQGTSLGYNWQIANNLNVAGIEFTPSTATGGTTFTTPTMALTTTGLGIGVTSPAFKLQVAGVISSNDTVRVSDGTTTTIMSIAGTGEGVVGTSSNHSLQFRTNNTERMRLDASGNLAVGGTTAGYKMNVSATTNHLGLYDTDVTNLVHVFSGNGNSSLYIGADDANVAASSNLIFAVDGSERARIDSSGNMGIGTTSPSSFDSSWNRLVVGTGSGDAGQTIYAGSASTASIAFADGTSGAQQYAGLIRYLHASDAMTFWTGAAERARIDSSGNLLVGTTSASGVARLTIAGGSIVASAPTSASSGTYSFSDNGSSPHTLRLYNSTDSNNTTNRFLICDAAASVLRAEIRSNGGIANFSGNNVNLSDRREKTNFAPAKSYLEAICAIPVQTFNYIDQNMEDDPGLTLGVVAQDVEAVAPELVMESNWGTEEDPKMRLSIYQTDLQYALMKCIQEQQAIIAQLQADVATLKGTP